MIMRARLRAILFFTATLAIFSVGISRAQDAPVHINVGGGPTFIASDLGQHFSTGWGPAIGVTFDASKRVGFQFEYAYRRFNINDNAPFYGATTFGANHQTHQLDFNMVANLTAPDKNYRVYAIVGPGAYYRKVEITQYVGNGIICDPFWYICGTYPVSAILGSRGGWDWGFNVGGGISLGMGGASFYIESRYHYVWGPDIEPGVNPLPGGSGTPGKANGSYTPLTFGFRF
jgi:hypothetical protein